MAVFIGSGLFFRLFRFGEIPVSLYWDEMAIWDDALSLAQTGHDMFARSVSQPLFISYGDYKLPVYIWLTSLVATVVKNPLVGVRFVSFLAGISMVPAIFLLSKYWGWNRQQRWAAGAMLAILPWSLHFSRAGFEGHLATALVLWSLVFLFRLLKQKSTTAQKFFDLGLIAVLSVSAFYTYFSVRYVWPILFIGVCLLWFKQALKHWKWLILALAIWLFALIPMLNADFYTASNQLRLSTVNVMNQPDLPNQVNLWRERAGNTLWSRVLYNQKTFIALDLAKNMTPFFSPQYLFDTGDPNLRHSSGYTGITWWSTLPLMLLGAVYLWRQNRRVFSFLILWWLISIIPAAVPLTVPHSLRSINALPVIPLLSAAGIGFLLEKKSVRNKVFLIALMLVMILEFCFASLHYFFVYPKLSAQDWQDGYLQLGQYLGKLSKEQRVIVNIDDERFYLYYLPYSQVPWQQIQQLPSIDFKRHQIGNIYFEQKMEDEFVGLRILPVCQNYDGALKEQIISGTGTPVFNVYEQTN